MPYATMYPVYCDSRNPPPPPPPDHPQEPVFENEYCVFLGKDGEAGCWWVWLRRPYRYAGPHHDEATNAFGTEDPEGRWIFVCEDWGCDHHIWALVHGLWWKLIATTGGHHSAIRTLAHATWVTWWEDWWHYWEPRPSYGGGSWAWVRHSFEPSPGLHFV